MDNIATKDDLKKLATKTELNDAIKKLATKDELKQVEKNLRGEILRIEEGVERVEERLESVSEKLSRQLDKLQNTLDRFVGAVDELRTENEVGSHQIRKLDKRVTKLESSLHS